MSRRSPRNDRCAAASSPSLPHDNMDASSCRFGQGVSLTLQIPPLFNRNSIAEAAGFTNRYLALIQANVDGDGGPAGRYHSAKRSPMAEISIRPAARADVPRLTEIYNYYVIHTAVTFDLDPYTIEKRHTWFEKFRATGRHRLLVAGENGVVPVQGGAAVFRV